jgi:hypothetical protein
MMTNLFLKPAPHAAGGVALVRDPETMIPLAEEGEWKAKSPFWTRRLRDGDVIDATEPAADEARAPRRKPAAK